jgi:hypothetical protein
MLQALYSRYKKLRQQGELPEVGFRSTDVHYVLVLDHRGHLKAIQECGEGGNSKTGQITVAPYRGKRTSGVKANFLCDTSKYLLGCEWGKDKEDGIKVFAKHLADAHSLHLSLKEAINHPHFDAVCHFLENCDPHTASRHIEQYWKRYDATVAPHAGARIETICLPGSRRCKTVAPHAGARIETFVGACLWGQWPVAPHAGARIETPMSRPTIPAARRRPPRGGAD